jgi:hypothetical protein
VSQALAVLLVVIVAMMVVAMWVWHFARSRSLLEQWAGAGGYRILASERRFFRRGPFFFTTAKGQEVFYVTVEDESARVRRAYVRVGGFFWGMFSDKVSVRWVD